MTQPNIILIVSDEERRNGWLQGKVDLPAHERLGADGLTFKRHYTHSSPCSPSRASLYTGRYLADHGVIDNVSFPAHTELDPGLRSIGARLRDVGYESAYIGKWHLSHSRTPNMADYGYSGWSGNDNHFIGGAWTGRHFDPVITNNAVNWLRDNAASSTPWFLTVALVNPHDVMWYPADQPDYRAANPEDAKALDFIIQVQLAEAGKDLTPVKESDYPERFDQLPENFEDDLHTKPEVQRAWRQVRNTQHFVGSISHDDHRSWLRQLDYYAWLHEELDVSLSRLLTELDALGIYDDTMIVYTSDHGDACGSHGLRAKLPCVYEEVMGVPLIVKTPAASAGAAADNGGGGAVAATTPGTTTSALSTHVDLAATILAAGGGDVDDLHGRDLSPVFADPATSVRDHVLFSQDSAQSAHLRQSRYAVRGFFDGTTKYARYYGIGGGIERDGRPSDTEKLFGVDADFDDHDHEWYDHNTDPHELTNLAHDRGRREQLRENFARLKALEAAEF